MAIGGTKMISKNIKTKLILLLSLLFVICSFAVGMVNNNTAFALTDIESFKMSNGAQVRLDDQRALRFTTSILKTDLQTIKGENNDIAVVTMILPTDTLEGRSFVAEDNIEVDPENGVKMKSIVFSDKFETPNLTAIEAVWDEDSEEWKVKNDGTGTHYIFRACLYDIKLENTVRNFSARSYLTVNGEVYDYTEYSEVNNSRNIWDIAHNFLDLYEEGTVEHDNLSAIASTKEVTVTSNYDANKSVTIDVKTGDKLSNYLDKLTDVKANVVGSAYFDSIVDANNVEVNFDAPVVAPLELTAKFSTITYGYDAKANCYYVGDNTAFKGDTVIIPEKYNDGTHSELDVKYVADLAFNRNANIKKVILPDTVEVIGHVAFHICTSLEYVAMPGVMDVSEGAATWFASRYTKYENVSQGNNKFKNTALKVLIVGSTFKVQDNQFWSETASGITRVYSTSTTPSSLTTTTNININEYKQGLFIYDHESEGLSSPIYFYSENKPTDTSYRFWHYVDGVPTVWTEYAVEPDLIDDQGVSYRYDKTNDCYYVAANSIWNIDGTSRDASLTLNVESIVIPEKYNDGVNGEKKVEYVANHAFRGNTYIKKVILPSSVVALGQYAFMDAKSLNYIAMPGVVEIDYNGGPTYTKYSLTKGNMTFRNAPLNTIIVSENFYADSNQFGTNGNYTGGSTGIANVYCMSKTVGTCNIAATNNVMIKAIHYLSDEEPTDTANSYWRYVGNVPTIWE